MPTYQCDCQPIPGTECRPLTETNYVKWNFFGQPFHYARCDKCNTIYYVGTYIRDKGIAETFTAKRYAGLLSADEITKFYKGLQEDSCPLRISDELEFIAKHRPNDCSFTITGLAKDLSHPDNSDRRTLESALSILGTQGRKVKITVSVIPAD